MRAYVKTIATTTAAGTTTLATGLKLIRIQNDDATNFVTLSFDAAIGTTSNPEGILLAATAWNFDSKDEATVVGDVLYHKSDTAGVNITVIGLIA